MSIVAPRPAVPWPAAPRPKGPPLNALRAYEAAARHSSFTAAARELSVSPGAVAQHVKAVEAWSGGALFERQSQGVVLTTLGTATLPALIEAFDALGAAVQGIRTQAAPQQLRIAALPSLAQLWLSPRLPAIRDAAAGIEISITAMEAPPNYKRDPFDLGIFLEEPPLAAASEALCREAIFPVCSPSLAAQLGSPGDLAKVTCLHDAMWADDWPRWLATACPDLAVETRGPVFSLYSLALEEARNGAGVVMGHDPLVQADLSTGRLVAPFATSVETGRILSVTGLRPAGEDPYYDALLAALKAPA